MLAEVHTQGLSTFMLAQVSNTDVEDVRAMYLEKTLNPKNHRDLWNKIPDFTPMNPEDILRPCEEHEFNIHEGFDKSKVMKFKNTAGLKDFPKWEWDQIFAVVS